MEHPMKLPADAEALIAELDQLESWESAAATDELRSVIATRRTDIATKLARTMLAWRRGDVPSADAGTEAAAPAPRAMTRVAGSSGQVVLRARAGEFRSTSESRPEPLEPRFDAPRPEPRSRAVEARWEPRTAAHFGYDRTRPRGAGYSSSEPDTGWNVPPIDPDWSSYVSNLLRDIGTSGSTAAELDAIVFAIEGWDRWRTMPCDVQRAMTAWLAARLHVIQDRGFSEDARVSHGFSLLSASMKRARPGFVHGLARTHRPHRGSWDEDADVLVASLEELLPPDAPPTADQKRRITALAALVQDVRATDAGVREAATTQLRRDVTSLLQGGLSHREPSLVEAIGPVVEVLEGPELRPLRRWLRALATRARDVEAEHERPDDAWPHWAFVRGRRAYLVGGTSRELARARLEQAFQFAELRWLPGESRRGAPQETHRAIKAGKPDLVIFLRAAAGGSEVEQELRPLCEELQVSTLAVDHGWSAGRIRQAIERSLAIRADTDASGPDDDDTGDEA
jgi:hypothetical protein